MEILKKFETEIARVRIKPDEQSESEEIVIGEKNVAKGLQLSWLNHHQFRVTDEAIKANMMKVRQKLIEAATCATIYNTGNANKRKRHRTFVEKITIYGLEKFFIKPRTTTIYFRFKTRLYPRNSMKLKELEERTPTGTCRVFFVCGG